MVADAENKKSSAMVSRRVKSFRYGSVKSMCSFDQRR
jgi:hypothetical protein